MLGRDSLRLCTAGTQEAQPSGWTAFEDPQPHASQAAAPPAARPEPQFQSTPAAAVPQQQASAEAFSGWQAFDAQPQPQQPAAPAAAAAGNGASTMKELPSVSILCC